MKPSMPGSFEPYPRQLIRLGTIAVKAKHILAGWRDNDNMRADPTLLTRILEYGSWAVEDSMRQPWAGLLAPVTDVTWD